MFFYFITERIKMTANQQGTQTNCPYCREVLLLAPSDYPVCRMAADFQRELDKLDVAVKNSKHNGNDLVIRFLVQHSAWLVLYIATITFEI